MLHINKQPEGSSLTIALAGRLDKTTAQVLEKGLKESPDGVTALTIDLAELEYISSAGLRVLLSAQKTMNGQGSMVIRNASEAVKEIFEVTGFSIS